MQLVLQHCCKTSWIVVLHVLPPTNQACLQQIRKLQVEKSFYSREKVESSTTCLADKWRNFRVCCDSREILSNQKSVFTQVATAWFAARQVWTKVVKRTALLFKSFCGSVAKQVARSCCPFYHSLHDALETLLMFPLVWFYSISNGPNETHA